MIRQQMQFVTCSLLIYGTVSGKQINRNETKEEKIRRTKLICKIKFRLLQWFYGILLYYKQSNFMILNHLPLDKMAAIMADDIFKWIFVNGNGRIPI